MDVLDIVRAAGLPAVATDEQERIVSWNDAAARLLRGFGNGAVGRTLQELLPSEGPGTANRRVRLGQLSGRPTRLAATVVFVLGPDPTRCTLVHLLRPLPGLSKLTAREFEVLRLLATGKGNREISECLSISVHTVRCHVRRILARLGVHSKLEAVCQAFRAGLV